MERVDAATSVRVIIRIIDGHVSKAGNYFVSAVVQVPGRMANAVGPAVSVILPSNIQRTDVCAKTNELHFKSPVFKFSFPGPDSPGSTAEQGVTLIVRLFEISPPQRGSGSNNASVSQVADAGTRITIPAGGVTAFSQRLSLLPTLKETNESPRQTSSASSDEVSIEEFGNLEISATIKLKSRPKPTINAAHLKLDDEESETGSPRSIDSRSTASSTSESSSPEHVRLTSLMFPSISSLPSSSVYKRLRRDPSRQSSSPSEALQSLSPLDEEDDMELLGSLHSSAIDGYVFLVRCYGFCNLPQPTRCFLTVKTTRDVAENKPARAGTMASPATRNFVWQDPFIVDVDARSASKDRSPTPRRAHDQPLGLFISLIDAVKKTYLGRCIIPVDRFVAGEQYNMSLVLDELRQSFVMLSITLQPSLSFQTSLFLKHPDLCRLEVFLHGVRRPRPGDDGETPPPATGAEKNVDMHHPFGSSVIAALHIEDDLASYLRRLADQPPKAPFQAVSLVSADAPLRVKPTTYQLTPPSQLSLHPQWHCLLEFTLSLDELHAPSAAIVIELYDLDFPKDGNGSVRFCGWAAVPLRSLAKSGVRDGEIISQAPTIHNVPSAPQELKKKHSILRQKPQPAAPSTIDCDYSNSCARHDYTMTMQLRRWVSRSFVRHLLRIQNAAASPSASGTQSPTARRDFSGIPPGGSLGNPAMQPAPLLRSQSQSRSQAILEWAGNRKRQDTKQPPAPGMSASTPNLDTATSSPLSVSTQQRRKTSVSQPTTPVAPPPAGQLQQLAATVTSAQPSPPLQGPSTPPLLRSKSKSSSVIVTEKPQPTGAVIAPSPPHFLSRTGTGTRSRGNSSAGTTSVAKKQQGLVSFSDTLVELDDSDDQYLSCDDVLSLQDRTRSHSRSRSSSDNSTESPPNVAPEMIRATSRDKLDTRDSTFFHTADHNSKAKADDEDSFDEPPKKKKSGASSDDEDTVDEEEGEHKADSALDVHPTSPIAAPSEPAWPSVVSPVVVPNRRGSPEIPPMSATRSVVSPAPVRPARSTGTPLVQTVRANSSSGTASPLSVVIPDSNQPTRSRSGSNPSVAAAGSSRAPLHVVVDPVRSANATPSPKSPTGIVPLGMAFPGGRSATASAKPSESSSSEEDNADGAALPDFSVGASPPGSPMQLVSVLNKVEKMLTKKLRKKQKTINELREQLQAAQEECSRARAEVATTQGQNQILREELERLRKDRDAAEKRSTAAQNQFREMLRSMQQTARSAGLLSSSASSSISSSWGPQAYSRAPPQSSQLQARMPSYDGYSEDDTSDYEFPSTTSMRPRESDSVNTQALLNSVSSFGGNFEDQLIAEASLLRRADSNRSLVVEPGSIRSLSTVEESARESDSPQQPSNFDREVSTGEEDDEDTSDAQSPSASDSEPRSEQLPLKHSFDEGLPVGRSPASNPVSTPLSQKHKMIKSSASFSSIGSSMSSGSMRSHDSLLTLPGSVTSAVSPRIASLNDWSDDDRRSDPAADERTSNSSLLSTDTGLDTLDGTTTDGEPESHVYL